ncbi:MAG TPA: WG repeat-containing protein [Kofleriaceae bacterium]|nr:WG repeat-containing protein [Kofleriaceae bacterium]
MRVVVVLSLLAACGASTTSAPPANVSTANAAPTSVAPADGGAPPACEPWAPEWPDGQADRVAFQDPATELWGYKTKAGAIALPAQYEEAWSFWPGGFAAVHLPAKDVTDPRHPFAFIDPVGKPIALAFLFDNGPDYYQEGFFRITAGGKHGFMNDRGQIVIAPQYDTAWAFCHGKARVEQAGETFYIDKTGARTAAPPDAEP